MSLVTQTLGVLMAPVAFQPKLSRWGMLCQLPPASHRDTAPNRCSAAGLSPLPLPNVPPGGSQGPLWGIFYIWKLESAFIQ